MIPQLTLGLGLALLVSVIGNVWQARVFIEQREIVAKTEEQRQSFKKTAEACGASIVALADAAEKQLAQGQQAVQKARQEAEQANRRAQQELTRPQAVPGDACASAQVETRQWLEQRRAAK